MADTKVFDSYWANSSTADLVGELFQKVQDFDRHIDMTGRWLTWRDLYYNYYLVNEQNYLFPNYGADGFKRLNINHFRAHLKHLLSLVTAQRAAPIPVAANSDHKSQAQTDFCKNILRYEGKEKKLESRFEGATEVALVLGAAYTAREWDAALGEEYGVDPITQRKLYKGDLVVTNFTPLDVVFDFAGDSWDTTNWVILRRYFNRWDLVEKFPLYADQIKAISIAPETKRHRLGHPLNEKNDDLIPLYTFYHKKTTAMSAGRMAIFIDADTCLFDGTLPYKKIPVSRISCDEQFNSPFPYTVAMDLLPIQKVYNALCSAVCTNQAAFGVQNVLIPRECGISLAELAEGLNAVYYDAAVANGAKPEPLNLLMTKPEIFQFITYLEEKMAQISGVNNTIQGNPEANLKSGPALAFVASQALIFISPLARSYNLLMEETWTGIVELFQEFATTPRMILVSGLNNKSEAKEFTSQDVADINRVIVEVGNPLTQTLAGRIQIAEQLLQAGVLNKEEYMTVLQTGQLEPLYAYEKAELLAIRQTLEALQAGKSVKAMVTDNHPLYIRELLTILASPEARTAPDNPVMINTLNAIQEHLNMWRTMDPALAAIQNIPPCPPPLMPGIPVPAASPENLGAGARPPGRENPNGSKVAGAPNLPGVTAVPGGQPAVPPPNMPNLPKGSPAPTQDGYQALQKAMGR